MNNDTPWPLHCNPELKRKMELDSIPRVTTSCADAVEVCEDIAAGKEPSECTSFEIFEWGEPPMEPGEDGRLCKEERCNKKQGYNIAFCGGDEHFCEFKEPSDE